MTAFLKAAGCSPVLRHLFQGSSKGSIWIYRVLVGLRLKILGIGSLDLRGLCLEQFGFCPMPLKKGWLQGLIGSSLRPVKSLQRPTCSADFEFQM